jgi:hypothetical protein
MILGEDRSLAFLCQSGEPRLAAEVSETGTGKTFRLCGQVRDERLPVDTRGEGHVPQVQL